MNICKQAVLGILITLLCFSAHADVTVTSKVVTQVMGREQKTDVLTMTQYKGDWMRTVTGQTIVLSNPKTTLFVDMAKKVFYGVPKDTAPIDSTEMDIFKSAIVADGPPVVVAGREVRMIAGRKTYPTTISLRLKLSIPSGLGQMMRPKEKPKPKEGIRGAQAVPPGGGEGFGMTIKLTVWTTMDADLSKLSGLGSATVDSAALTLVTPEFKTALQRIKGFPMRSDLSQSMAMQSPGGESLHIIREVVKIDVRPLSAALFLPPKGFKQVPNEGSSGAMIDMIKSMIPRRKANRPRTDPS